MASPNPKPSTSASTALSPFATKIAALNDNDKNRIICAVMHGNLTSIDWKEAAADFGSASANSMHTMYLTAMKKYRGDAGKKKPEADQEAKADAPTTPKKRKAPAKKIEGEPEKKVKKEEPNDSD